MSETKYCMDCGAQINGKAEICPECGVRQASPGTYHNTNSYRNGYQEKNPVLAAILSFLIVGVGQVYNGQVVKGIVLFVAAIISAMLWFIGIGIILSIIIWLFAIYDAYTTAIKINEGEFVKDLGS